MLDIVAIGQLTIQTEENGEKSHFGPNLGPLGPTSDHQFFFKFFFKYKTSS